MGWVMGKAVHALLMCMLQAVGAGGVLPQIPALPLSCTS